MTVSAVWVEEDWNMFEFGAAAQQSDGAKVTHQDPMGFMDSRGGSRRMSQENIRKLCPEGDQTPINLLCQLSLPLPPSLPPSLSLIPTQGVVIC